MYKLTVQQFALNPDFGHKRHLLRMLVDRIIIHPDKLTIRGAIPQGTVSNGSTRKSGSVESPSSSYYARNSLPFELEVLV